MAGILIYKHGLQHYSFVNSSDEAYEFMERSLSKENYQILWEKAGTTLDKIEGARNTKDNLVERLNHGEKINLKKELYSFFK